MTMPQGNTPAPPPTPQAPAIVGTNTPAPVALGSPAELFRGLREQRRILGDQLETLEEKREDLTRQIREGALSDVDRAVVQQRIAQVDQQITAASIRIAEADAQVAVAATVPGALIEPPQLPRTGPPEELVAMGIGMLTLLAFPIVIAYARRIWRRHAVTISLPPELTDRLSSLERSVDTVAIEVERIGEGQRFVSQLLADRAQAAAGRLPASKEGQPRG